MNIYILCGIVFMMFAGYLMVNSGSTEEKPIEIEPKIILDESFTVIDKQDMSLYYMRVIHDNKRNVTCWAMGVNNGGGISCLPDDEVVWGK